MPLTIITEPGETGLVGARLTVQDSRTFLTVRAMGPPARPSAWRRGRRGGGRRGCRRGRSRRGRFGPAVRPHPARAVDQGSHRRLCPLYGRRRCAPGIAALPKLAAARIVAGPAPAPPTHPVVGHGNGRSGQLATSTGRVQRLARGSHPPASSNSPLKPATVIPAPQRRSSGEPCPVDTRRPVGLAPHPRRRRGIRRRGRAVLPSAVS